MVVGATAVSNSTNLRNLQYVIVWCRRRESLVLRTMVARYLGGQYFMKQSVLQAFDLGLRFGQYKQPQLQDLSAAEQGPPFHPRRCWNRSEIQGGDRQWESDGDATEPRLSDGGDH